VTVDDYIASVDVQRRPTLEALRALVRETVPDVTESVQHKMAYYSHHGDLCAFAAQKNYFSFYMMGGGDVVERHRAQLGKLNCGKGCIRFRSLDEAPLETLRTMLRESARANEAAA
jgi:uncharacterized protein YdhG (YjbR/CyaY superfamily)